MRKNNIRLYFFMRLLIFIMISVVIYHCAYYFLPKAIQDDQFSFVGELDMIINLMLGFSIVYSGIIYWEYQNFNRKQLIKLKNAAFAVLCISLIITLAFIFLAIKL